MISAFFGPPAIAQREVTLSLSSWTCAAQPVGWAVTQTNPRTFGLMIITPTVRSGQSAVEQNSWPWPEAANLARRGARASPEDRAEAVRGASPGSYALFS